MSASMFVRRVIVTCKVSGHVKFVSNCLRKMAANGRTLSTIAVAQMTSTGDKESNFKICTELIKRAKQKGAQMVFLPEAFDYIANSKEEAVRMAEPIDGPLMKRFRSLAFEEKLWLSLGGFHEKGPNDNPKRIYNSHVVLDSDGSVVSVYRKCHLFDVTLPTGQELHESHYVVPGNEIVAPVRSPVGKIGLAICYDLRFPEMSTVMTKMGAEILTFPSAFTVPTGMAHWEVLLRSRAIENQCYVVAAAQIGRHNDKRSSYGHALIADPWGTVIAQCINDTDVSTAEIDLEHLRKVRASIPVAGHRRHDLYGDVSTISAKRVASASLAKIDANSTYQFGQVILSGSQLFFKTGLTMAFVNKKPVLPGHVLVSPIRPAKKFTDLTSEEIHDLFLCVQRVQRIIEEEYNTHSTTIALQDGPEAGQSIEHVHVHIVPRKPTDFDHTDRIYERLRTHDKPENKGVWRTADEMAAEASHLASYFYATK